jgi:NTP pyrophosphatase (non-canonical NTP hydrolase)
MYYLYHIPGKKIGVTTNLIERVENQQGYNEGEYEVIMSTEDIDLVSKKEISLQKALGYRVDRQLYKDLHNNNYKQLNNMKINVTEMTTTFPCPVNKLKGKLMDEIGMQWETIAGSCGITKKSIEWIMDNVKSSQFTQDRCFIYNKAFARWFDNHDVYGIHGLDNAKQMNDQYNGRCRSGALSPAGVREDVCKHKTYQECDCGIAPFTMFDNIRQWAFERGLYDKGDAKTQALKLVEEVGETCRAILKADAPEMIDGIGDCVVVLTNLAELIGCPIEECIRSAYEEISTRKGKMVNGTFKKD